MIPADFLTFLTASTQASAALIGLLFVSVSVAPERVFGDRAEAGRQALAASAFTALANVFFVSFGSLIPHLSFGVLVTVAGIVAASQTLALLPLLPSWRRERTLWRSLPLFVGSATIYAFEIVIGVQLVLSPGNTGALTGLVELLLGSFGIGLARAWELLGASQSRGSVGAILRFIRRRRKADAGAGEPKSEPAAPSRPDDTT